MMDEKKVENLIWDAYTYARTGKIVLAMRAFYDLVTYVYKGGFRDGEQEILDRIRPQ